MLSLTQFRKHLLPVFRLMIDTKQDTEVIYKGKVYDVRVTATDKVPVITRSTRKFDAEVRQIETVNCPACGSLMFNSICMNSQCIHATGTLLAAENAVQDQAKE